MKISNPLRKLVRRKLIEAVPEGTPVYYQLADDKALYPHVVFLLDSITTLSDDMNRRDFSLLIDYYSRDPFDAEDVSDLIQDALNGANLPQDDILPTFYLNARRTIIEEDKRIIHRQIEFTVHMNERIE